MIFREFLENICVQELREFVERKPWKARRADILKFWQGLQPNLPLNPTPVSKQHRGTKFREDGLRITGSPDFINGVLSRLKDLLRYESNPATKLDIEYRQIENTGKFRAEPIYVCYIHVMERQSETSAMPAPIVA